MNYNELVKKYGNINIPYQDLLKTSEWQDKREKILKRDEYCCQKCGKKKTELFEIAKLKDILKLKGGKTTWRTTIKQFTIPENIEKGHYWFLSPRNFEKKKGNYKGLKYIETPYKYFLIKSNKPYYLHVHHEKYILNIFPWENYDTDLITICNWCHIEVHSTSEIKAFRLHNNKLIKANLTPCYKCHGKGLIPEYMHIEDGLCFHCLGKRFEELIDCFNKYCG